MSYTAFDNLHAGWLNPFCMTLSSGLHLQFHYMQLSKNCIKGDRHLAEPVPFKMVEVNGIEPMTPCVQGRCSPS